jgi:hypothetical protein
MESNHCQWLRTWPCWLAFLETLQQVGIGQDAVGGIPEDSLTVMKARANKQMFRDVISQHGLGAHSKPCL